MTYDKTIHTYIRTKDFYLSDSTMFLFIQIGIIQIYLL